MNEDEYKKEIKDLEQLSTTAVFLSLKNQKRKISSWREEEASLIFGRISMASISILRLMPNSSFYSSSYGGIDFWDFSSIAALIRNIMEAVIIFFYVAIDEITEEESEFRHLIWFLHSKIELHEIIKTNFDSQKIQNLEEQIRDVKGKIEENEIYKNLSEKEQKEILKGKRNKNVTKKELIERMGIRKDFWFSQFKYCSNYTHITGYSNCQLSDFNINVNAGESDAALESVKMLILFQKINLSFAINFFLKMLPDNKSFISPDVFKLVSFYCETFEEKVI